MVLEPCQEQCGITLVVEKEFGEDSGPGMIEAAAVLGWVDASRRLYVAGVSPVSHIRVFGPDGTFLRRIGRPGEGPGEFLHRPHTRLNFGSRIGCCSRCAAMSSGFRNCRRSDGNKTTVGKPNRHRG